ncbi:YdeI/OmpD-associated family protein [Carnobacterium sp.]|uniref:YdeI/OmpD-associated family protein n=1 Tax=Carnobacterium sp. TaxID=48221 RepID=UPI002FC77806
MESKVNPIYFENREEWRHWLLKNADKWTEIWFLFPLKASHKSGVSYNDAVEEALCFGWIDSTVRSFNEEFKVQRFSRRNPKSTYSQANKERLHWLMANQLVHPTILDEVSKVLSEIFVFPEDILCLLKEDQEVWENYQTFSDPYKRIRIAYIDAARKRPDEFHKRLNNFIRKTKQGSQIKGYGGINKYY